MMDERNANIRKTKQADVVYRMFKSESVAKTIRSHGKANLVGQR